MDNPRKNLIITISGKVQGVGFRYFIKHTADSMKIYGIAKNQPDGSLYIEAEAEELVLEDFVAKCKQGSASAKIDNVYILEGALKDYRDFRVAL